MIIVQENRNLFIAFLPGYLNRVTSLNLRRPGNYSQSLILKTPKKQFNHVMILTNRTIPQNSQQIFYLAFLMKYFVGQFKEIRVDEKNIQMFGPSNYLTKDHNKTKDTYLEILHVVFLRAYRTVIGDRESRRRSRTIKENREHRQSKTKIMISSLSDLLEALFISPNRLGSC